MENNSNSGGPGGTGSKKVWWWVIGIIVVIIIVAAVSASRGGSTGGNSVLGTTGSQSPQMTLAELAMSNQSEACQFSSSEASSTTSGTVYVSDGQVRSDVTSTAADGKVTMVHAIIQTKSSTMYTWIDGMSQGYEMAWTSTSTPPTAGANAQTGTAGSYGAHPSFDTNKSYSYQCKPWTADNSEFTPPTNVTFMNMASMMHEMQGMPGMNMGASAGASGSASGSAGAGAGAGGSCAQCASVPAAYQAQCRAAMHC